MSSWIVIWQQETPVLTLWMLNSFLNDGTASPFGLGSQVPYMKVRDVGLIPPRSTQKIKLGFLHPGCLSQSHLYDGAYLSSFQNSEKCSVSFQRTLAANYPECLDFHCVLEPRKVRFSTDEFVAADGKLNSAIQILQIHILISRTIITEEEHGPHAWVHQLVKLEILYQSNLDNDYFLSIRL